MAVGQHRHALRRGRRLTDDGIGTNDRSHGDREST
jgi:hypothetical protein